MKRAFKKKWLLVLLGLLGLITIVNSVNFFRKIEPAEYTETQPEESYLVTVEHFNLVSEEDVANYKNFESKYILYFGRESCGYCRSFVPELNRISNKYSVPVYYIDTENLIEKPNTNEVFNSLNIEYVPSVFFVSDNEMNFFDAEEGSYENFLKNLI